VVASVGYGTHARGEPMSVVLRETADLDPVSLQARVTQSGSSGPYGCPELSAAGRNHAHDPAPGNFLQSGESGQTYLTGRTIAGQAAQYRWAEFTQGPYARHRHRYDRIRAGDRTVAT
jgi:hypothetical protein